MAYFTTQQDFFICSDIPSEEKRKLNDFLIVLEESGVGKIKSGGKTKYRYRKGTDAKR